MLYGSFSGQTFGVLVFSFLLAAHRPRRSAHGDHIPIREARKGMMESLKDAQPLLI